MESRPEKANMLVTGFSPFGDSGVNPSVEVARLLDGTSVAGHPIFGVELPVTAGGAPEALKEAVERHSPSVVLSLGLANGRSMLALERVAVNVLDFPIPDNDGAQPIDDPVVEDGPAAYFSSLPIKAILAAWKEAGIPGYVSNTAGTYVCNQTFYACMHLSKERGYRAGVLHVPYLPEQAAEVGDGAPSMPLELMVRATEMALEVSMQKAEDTKLAAGAIS